MDRRERAKLTEGLSEVEKDAIRYRALRTVLPQALMVAAAILGTALGLILILLIR